MIHHGYLLCSYNTLFPTGGVTASRKAVTCLDLQNDIVAVGCWDGSVELLQLGLYLTRIHAATLAAMVLPQSPAPEMSTASIMVTCIKLSSCLSRLAFGNSTGEVFVFNISEIGQSNRMYMIASHNDHKGHPVLSLSWSAHAKFVCSGCSGGKIIEWFPKNLPKNEEKMSFGWAKSLFGMRSGFLLYQSDFPVTKVEIAPKSLNLDNSSVTRYLLLASNGSMTLLLDILHNHVSGQPQPETVINRIIKLEPGIYQHKYPAASLFTYSMQSSFASGFMSLRKSKSNEIGPELILCDSHGENYQCFHLKPLSGATSSSSLVNKHQAYCPAVNTNAVLQGGFRYVIASTKPWIRHILFAITDDHKLALVDALNMSILYVPMFENRTIISIALSNNILLVLSQQQTAVAGERVSPVIDIFEIISPPINRSNSSIHVYNSSLYRSIRMFQCLCQKYVASLAAQSEAVPDVPPATETNSNNNFRIVSRNSCCGDTASTRRNSRSNSVEFDDDWEMGFQPTKPPLLNQELQEAIAIESNDLSTHYERLECEINQAIVDAEHDVEGIIFTRDPRPSMSLSHDSVESNNCSEVYQDLGMYNHSTSLDHFAQVGYIVKSDRQGRVMSLPKQVVDQLKNLHKCVSDDRQDPGSPNRQQIRSSIMDKKFDELLESDLSFRHFNEAGELVAHRTGDSHYYFGHNFDQLTNLCDESLQISHSLLEMSKGKYDHLIISAKPRVNSMALTDEDRYLELDALLLSTQVVLELDSLPHITPHVATPPNSPMKSSVINVAANGMETAPADDTTTEDGEEAESDLPIFEDSKDICWIDRWYQTPKNATFKARLLQSMRDTSLALIEDYGQGHQLTGDTGFGSTWHDSFCAIDDLDCLQQAAHNSDTIAKTVRLTHVSADESSQSVSEFLDLDRSPLYCVDLIATTGFGMKLVISTTGEVIVQSFRRLANGEMGPAERSGQVRVGDQLLAINDISLETADVESIVKILDVSYLSSLSYDPATNEVIPIRLTLTTNSGRLSDSNCSDGEEEQQQDIHPLLDVLTSPAAAYSIGGQSRLSDLDSPGDSNDEIESLDWNSAPIGGSSGMEEEKSSTRFENWLGAIFSPSAKLFQPPITTAIATAKGLAPNSFTQFIQRQVRNRHLYPIAAIVSLLPSNGGQTALFSPLENSFPLLFSRQIDCVRSVASQDFLDELFDWRRCIYYSSWFTGYFRQPGGSCLVRTEPDLAIYPCRHLKEYPMAVLSKDTSPTRAAHGAAGVMVPVGRLLNSSQAVAALVDGSQRLWMYASGVEFSFSLTDDDYSSKLKSFFGRCYSELSATEASLDEDTSVVTDFRPAEDEEDSIRLSLRNQYDDIVASLMKHKRSRSGSDPLPSPKLTAKTAAYLCELISYVGVLTLSHSTLLKQLCRVIERWLPLIPPTASYRMWRERSMQPQQEATEAAHLSQVRGIITLYAIYRGCGTSYLEIVPCDQKGSAMATDLIQPSSPTSSRYRPLPLVRRHRWTTVVPIALKILASFSMESKASQLWNETDFITFIRYYRDYLDLDCVGFICSQRSFLQALRVLTTELLYVDSFTQSSQLEPSGCGVSQFLQRYDKTLQQSVVNRRNLSIQGVVGYLTENVSDLTGDRNGSSSDQYPPLLFCAVWKYFLYIRYQDWYINSRELQLAVAEQFAECYPFLSPMHYQVFSCGLPGEEDSSFPASPNIRTRSLSQSSMSSPRNHHMTPLSPRSSRSNSVSSVIFGTGALRCDSSDVPIESKELLSHYLHSLFRRYAQSALSPPQFQLTATDFSPTSNPEIVLDYINLLLEVEYSAPGAILPSRRLQSRVMEVLQHPQVYAIDYRRIAELCGKFSYDTGVCLAIHRHFLRLEECPGLRGDSDDGTSEEGEIVVTLLESLRRKLAILRTAIIDPKTHKSTAEIAELTTVIAKLLRLVWVAYDHLDSSAANIKFTDMFHMLWTENRSQLEAKAVNRMAAVFAVMLVNVLTRDHCLQLISSSTDFQNALSIEFYAELYRGNTFSSRIE